MPINTTDIVFDSFTERDRQWHAKILKFCFHVEALLTAKSKSGIKIPSWECHTIARLINLAYPEISVVDGRLVGLKITEMFANPNDPDSGLHSERSEAFSVVKTTFRIFTSAHSWNMTPDGNIIDCYPCGIYATGPIMATSHPDSGHFGANHYQEMPEVRSGFDEEKSLSTAKQLLEIAGITYPVA